MRFGLPSRKTGDPTEIRRGCGNKKKEATAVASHLKNIKTTNLIHKTNLNEKHILIIGNMSKKTCAASRSLVIVVLSVHMAPYFLSRLSMTCLRFLPKSGNT